MASICNDPAGRKRIQFVAPDGVRKAIRLGKVSRKAADGIARHVEELLASKMSGQPIDRQTAAWLGEIGGELFDRLAAVGLVEPRQPPTPPLTVGRLVSEFLAARIDVRPGTMINLQQAGKALVAFLGEAREVASVTEADAEAYMRHLLAGGLADNTARRRAGRARELFTWAIKRREIEANPFSVLKVATGGNPERQQYVSVEAINRVIDACPSAEWRLIVALSRFGGLRCPSEHLALTWDDILWDQGRFVVRSPKTGVRTVPIFPELAPYLRECFEAAEEGAENVITRNRVESGHLNGTTTNWRTQFLRIIKRAGVTAWPKLFHQLRAACQTDLSERFPIHVVCDWLGNSEAVAREHYLQVTDEHFQAAQKAAHFPAQQGRARSSTERKPEGESPEKQASLQLSATPCVSAQAEPMTLTGFEPVSQP